MSVILEALTIAIISIAAIVIVIVVWIGLTFHFLTRKGDEE